jgi:hypothetical protein
MDKKIITVLIVFLCVISAGGLYLFNISKPNLRTFPSPVPTQQPILGGDRDEHGCIGSAGYSWCEAKNKCIRIWEEDCNSRQAIQKALAKKENKQLSETFITIRYETADYASGGVSFGAKDAPGGVFLAAKINNNWQIVFAGNGSINCPEIKKLYEFPPEMLQGFCD